MTKVLKRRPHDTNADKVDALVNWLATPKTERTITTLGELAEVLDVNRNTLTSWKASRQVRERVLQQTRGILYDAIPGAYRALSESASNPDGRNNSDRRLLLEMTGQYTPGLQVGLDDQTVDILKQLGASSPWAETVEGVVEDAGVEDAGDGVGGDGRHK